MVTGKRGICATVIRKGSRRLPPSFPSPPPTLHLVVELRAVTSDFSRRVLALTPRDLGVLYLAGYFLTILRCGDQFSKDTSSVLTILRCGDHAVIKGKFFFISISKCRDQFSKNSSSLLTIWRRDDYAVLKGRVFVVDHVEMGSWMGQGHDWSKTG